MSQIERFAQMLNVELRGLRAKAIAHEEVSGAFLEETIVGGCTLLETEYEVDSDADPALIARILRNAHNVCIVGNTIRRGVTQVNQFRLNGQRFDPAAYPPRQT